jgi:hypothetical protein
MHLGSGDPRSDLGPILDYLKDIAKLPPEVTRPEQYSFNIRILNGAINAQNNVSRVDPEYVFAMRRIKGSVSRPEVNGELVHLMDFNVVDQGRGRGGIYRIPISMAVLVGMGGPAHDMVWDSFYAFVPGSDIQLDFLPALAQFPQVSDATFIISVTGDLVRTRRLPDGTLVIPGVNG